MCTSGDSGKGKVKMDRGFIRGFLSVVAVGLLFAVHGFADPINPVYTVNFSDAVTGDNAFIASDGNRYWTVDPGADSYQNDFYERPTVQTFVNSPSHSVIDGTFATYEYFEYLDIVSAQAGFDDQYLYIAIDMFGLDKSTTDGVDTLVGLVERYGFRISNDPDGRNGLLLTTDNPLNKLGTTFGQEGTFGYEDTDGDVGGRGLINGFGPSGRSVTKSDNPYEESGPNGSMNGYDSVVISDGKSESDGTSVLWARIDPNDETIVELAFDYSAFGFSKADLGILPYLEFEAIKGGAKDPQNYLWNDKYTQSEAGSPNASSTYGLSEFGTQGLGNIYELDTLSGGAIVVPEPASLILTLTGLAWFGGVARARRRRAARCARKALRSSSQAKTS